MQMHSAARRVTNSFACEVPSNFRAYFKYNNVYYTRYNDQPATIEEFVERNFMKFINNAGEVCMPKDYKEEEDVLIQKATDNKLMLLDSQGSRYHLYDLEIGTQELVCT